MKRYQLFLIVIAFVAAAPVGATEKSVFRKDNLVAWCVVPFDKNARSPEQRAEMLERLGLKALAYDWRPRHVPEFEREIVAMGKHGIAFVAHHSPGGAANPANIKMYELAAKHHVKPEMWIIVRNVKHDDEAERLRLIVEKLMPSVEMARKYSCRLGLYNHGGWTGEPATLIKLTKLFRAKGHDHVGIIYNFHHGHEHLDIMPKAFNDMVPYLFCLNLNGMNPGGPKILPLGEGSEDLKLLKMIKASGYRGPIGILDHVNEEDTAVQLRKNLAGLKKLLVEMGDTEAAKTYE